MKCLDVDCNALMEMVVPLLEQGDPRQIAEAVSHHWTNTQLCQMLHCGEVDVRKVICLILGLVGDLKCVSVLNYTLKDEDIQVYNMAEHALWSIWFRSGSPKAIPYFKRGIDAMNNSDHHQALDHFHRAVYNDPKFAEAFDQCAISHYMLEQYHEAIQDCLAVLDIVPTHFGALACMGHCYAEMDDLPAASRCYKQTLAINPRMDAIANTLSHIQQRMGC